MKNLLHKVTTVKNRTEILDFRGFMNKHNGQRGQSKIGHSPKQSKSINSLTAYSLYINPAAFIDPTFILIAAGVFTVAILEKKLAENGLISIAATLSSILRLALPIVALASIIYLINHSSLLL